MTEWPITDHSPPIPCNFQDFNVQRPCVSWRIQQKPRDGHPQRATGAFQTMVISRPVFKCCPKPGPKPSFRIDVRQLGWWNSQLIWKNIHQRFQTTKQNTSEYIQTCCVSQILGVLIWFSWQSPRFMGHFQRLSGLYQVGLFHRDQPQDPRKPWAFQHGFHGEIMQIQWPSWRTRHGVFSITDFIWFGSVLGRSGERGNLDSKSWVLDLEGEIPPCLVHGVHV